MELKFVVPNMEKTFGNLEFGGKVEPRRGDTQREGGRIVVKNRRYKLYVAPTYEENDLPVPALQS